MTEQRREEQTDTLEFPILGIHFTVFCFSSS